jgi:hypothetical protein
MGCSCGWETEEQNEIATHMIVLSEGLIDLKAVTPKNYFPLVRKVRLPGMDGQVEMFSDLE